MAVIPERARQIGERQLRQARDELGIVEIAIKDAKARGTGKDAGAALRRQFSIAS